MSRIRDLIAISAGLAVLLGIFWSPSDAKRLHPEKYYQDKWCAEQGGQTEVVLPDRTRCDCLTDTYAVEFDFANKWAEAIGQALYYSLQTGKRAGIVLIVGEEDWRYWVRLGTTVHHFDLPIDIWRIPVDGKEEE